VRDTQVVRESRARRNAVASPNRAPKATAGFLLYLFCT
jgi:hypothetical protein